MKIEKVEEKIYIEQEKYIKENFGKKAFDNANYGWSVDEGEESIQVSTKVYGHGILTSTGHTSGKITHDFEEWENPTILTDIILGKWWF